MPTWITDNSKYILLFLGVLAGLPLVWKRRKRMKLSRSWLVPLLCLVFTVLSLFSAIAFAALESLISGKQVSFGAISTYGIYFICPFLLFAAARIARLEKKELLDAFALYAVPSLFLMRCNCLISGCCLGRVIPGTDSRYPTREIELVFYIIIFLLLLWREKHGKNVPGQQFPLLMAAYGVFRFIEEWFREGTGSSYLHLAHFWSILAVAAGASIFFELGKRAGRKKK